MKTQTYVSFKSLKGIERKKVLKEKRDDKDNFDGTPTASAIEVPLSAFSASYDTQNIPLSKERAYRRGMTYNKACVGTPIIHKSDYALLSEGYVIISSSYRKIKNVVSCIKRGKPKIGSLRNIRGHYIWKIYGKVIFPSSYIIE